jgi:ACT domain-containing protein
LNSGEEAAQFIATNIYEKAGDEAGELANVLDTINWNDTSALELSKALSNAGIATEFTTEELNLLIDAMQVDAVLAIDQLAEKIKSLNAFKDLS